MERMHGGDIISFEKQYGKTPVDFSISTNPLGLPRATRDAIQDSVKVCEKYPDPLCRELTEAINAREHVPVSNILCGAGATDLLFRLVYAKKPKRALVLAPSFNEYETALQTVNCEIVHHVLQEENEFAITGSILKVITSDIDMVLIGEPNNPTGQITSKSVMESILSKCTEIGALLVLDESFNGFLGKPQENSMRNKISLFENLFIIRDFSNLYAMPGLRLGYCMCAKTDLLDQMQKAAQPWAVSSIAQVAGIAAIADVGYVLRTQALLIEEKKILWNCLNIAGFKIYGSEANYIFFKANIPDFGKKMAEQGIMLRDCSSYSGLADGYYRLAVRPRADNRLFINALQKVL